MPASNKRLGQFSRDMLNVLRDYFTSNDITFEKLAELSEQLCGQAISVDRLKVYARSDPDGNWTTLKNAGRPGQDDVSEEVSHIRRILYQQIAMVERDGLFVTGDLQMVYTLLHDVEGIEIEQYPGRINPNLVNAYMNLLDKSSVNLKMSGTSARTAREQAIDLARDAIARMAADTDGHKS